MPMDAEEGGILLQQLIYRLWKYFLWATVGTTALPRPYSFVRPESTILWAFVDGDKHMGVHSERAWLCDASFSTFKNKNSSVSWIGGPQCWGPSFDADEDIEFAIV